MITLEKWIWLNDELYPNSQRTVYSGFNDKGSGNYTVAEFKKEYVFSKKVVSATLRYSADTEFQLFCNNQFLATGPIPVGGDFLYNDLPRSKHYACEHSIMVDSKVLEFFAIVKMMPVGINEYSQGHGGFMLTAYVTFEDGTSSIISTDDSWLARKNHAYIKPYYYDNTIAADGFSCAKEVHNIWKCVTAPIKNRTEEIIRPCNNTCFTIKPHTQTRETLVFDKVYAGFIKVSVKTNGLLNLVVGCFERDEDYVRSEEHFTLNKDTAYRGFQLHSVGGFVLTIENSSDQNAEVEVSLITAHYPVYTTAKTTTSDIALNEVLAVCTHSLKYCRQLMHLDSPLHSECLACTGDYYIETLMTAFTFGDMDLSKFDVLRTAELLRNHDGRMFHTTYSLIWVLMLRDVYYFTNDYSLLEECLDALMLLLNRFESYVGENKLIETPPDYMFIDWLYVDKISLHHPPKALGQTCLNMFYFGALTTASEIFSILNQHSEADKCHNKAVELRDSINKHLYCNEKGLYFEGLNSPTPEHLVWDYMPQNTDKRYYRQHANILAAYFGVCDTQTAQSILDKVMTNEDLSGCQPYFMHFLLEAIFRNGLREKYALQVLNKWKPFIADFNKGLPEGFITPEPGYSFDYSHAWAGTPAYALPKAILGFTMLEPGFRKIQLDLSLLGLDSACVEMPTPFGIIRCELKKGHDPILTIPPEIEVIFLH